MMPVVFTIPFLGWQIPGYGLMLMLGLLLSIMWAARRAARSGADPDVVLNCGFIALAAGVVGSRMMYVVHYWDQFRYRGGLLDTALAVVDIRKGGLEFYGGFILTVLAVVVYLRWRAKVSLRWYLDILAPSAALGQALARVGCFLNGCCWGGVCELPWSVRFPFGSNAASQHWQARLPGAALPRELLYEHPSGLVMPIMRESVFASDEQIAAVEADQAQRQGELEALSAQVARAATPEEKRQLEKKRRLAELRARAAAAEFADIRAQMKKYGLTAAEVRALARRHSSLPVHPTQLYTTIYALLLALLLNAIYWRRTRDGQVICMLLLVEPAARWVLEVIRADNPTDTLGVFTISQFLAVCLTLAGLVGLLMLQRMSPRSPRAKLWEPVQVRDG